MDGCVLEIERCGHQVFSEVAAYMTYGSAMPAIDSACSIAHRARIEGDAPKREAQREEPRIERRERDSARRGSARSRIAAVRGLDLRLQLFETMSSSFR